MPITLSQPLTCLVCWTGEGKFGIRLREGHSLVLGEYVDQQDGLRGEALLLRA